MLSMSLNLLSKFGATSGVTDFTTEFWNAFVEEVALALTTLQDKSASFDEARAQLIQAALFRLNEILLPAFEAVQEYQQGGFLVAPILDDSEVAFTEGFTTLGIRPDHKAMFRPTPFVALVRESTYADVAIARTTAYDAETGALSIEIVAVIGDAGPWSDVIVSATAGSVQAQNQFLTETRAARDKAEDWAEKPENSAVETGKYSALHHAAKAAASARAAEGFKDTASGAAGTATTKAGEAGSARDKAQDWAEKPEDNAVEAGKYSARHHAANAAASARAAATFDPSSYYTKGQTYTQVEIDNALDDKADTSALGEMAGLDKATASQIRAATGDAGLTADSLASAAAVVTLTDAATIAVDWSAFVDGEVSLGANRTLGNPTNVAGTHWRSLLVKASSGTRSLSFGSNYKGALPTLTDITSSKWYLLTLYAYSATHIVVISARAL